MNKMDASMMKKCFLAGAKALESRKEYINELNVFPVPDGDTGTNMTMTIMSAVREVNKVEDLTISNLCKAISSGSLRGARGNSGVILSQIFRGFSRDIKKLDYLEVTDLGNSIQHAASTAYKAVMKPKEGTILSVINAGSEEAIALLMEGNETDIVSFVEKIAEKMEETLERTPEMLPLLKQAGVIDSGGEGLMTFVRGALAVLQGKEVDYQISQVDAKATPAVSMKQAEGAEDIKFGYCTEFIIMLEKDQDTVEQQLREYLQGIGDCIVVVADEDIVKVHVHTNDPGLAIQKALTFGELTNMKIDNMREEHQEKLIRDAEKVAAQQLEEQKKAQDDENGTIERTKAATDEHKQAGFIVVSVGDGLSDIFTDLGADVIIKGGQTMNPSTEDMLKAIDLIDADTIFILPNNGNVFLVAKQAAEMVKNREIMIIPSKNIPQGIAAMINYMAGQSAQTNATQMTSAIDDICSGEVTYAVRDTKMDGRKVKKGDFMGISDGKILSSGKDLQKTTKELVESLINEESELVSLYYGEGRTEEQAEEIADAILEKHPELEVEVQYGGQPVYSYYISVE